MLCARPKNSKSQTPTRNINSHPKITQIVGIKKSDPFLRDLKDVYDKENVNPNQKDRVKSFSNKNQNQRSPKQKNSKYNKTFHHQTYYNNRISNKLNSNSKEYNSSELYKNQSRLKSSNRKSTEKDEPMVNHFQQEYYSAKEERQTKKTKVTLKDIKKRRSIHDSQQQYKYQEDTKESLTRDLIGSLKKSLMKSNEKNVNYQGFKSHGSAEMRGKNEQLICCIHPDKRASHKLIQQNKVQAYCEKCAINLVTKGHQMEQIVPQRPSTRQDNLKEERLDILKDFLFKLDRLEPIAKQTRNDISSFKGISQARFEQQQKQLEKYYIRLSQELTLSYERSSMTLKMYFSSVSEQLQKNDQLLNIINSKIQSIKEDILPNVNTIVQSNKVQEDQFNSIISNYQEELKSVQKNLRQLYECSYSNYFCDYSKNQNILINFRDMVSPPIVSENMQEVMETKRRTTDDSDGKRVEYFRLSFGKEVPDSDYKTL